MFTVGILYPAVCCRIHVLFAAAHVWDDICHAWAFCGCPFLLYGQCEGLGTWDGQQANPTLFFLR